MTSSAPFLSISIGVVGFLDFSEVRYGVRFIVDRSRGHGIIGLWGEEESVNQGIKITELSTYDPADF